MRWLPGFVGCCALLVATAAEAAPNGPAIVDALTYGSGADRAALLVGPAGQLYWQTGTEWKRKHGGGVAADLRGAISTPSGLYGVGRRSPTYRYQKGVWHVLAIPNRGSTTVGNGGKPAVAVGKHVYVLRGSTWSRLGSANRAIISLHVRAAGQAYVITRTNQLRLVRRNRSNIVRVTLAAGDSLTTVAGARGEVYAVSRNGAVVRIRGLTASPVVVPASLQGFQLHRAAPGPKGLLLAGVVRKNGASTGVVARAHQGKLGRLHGLPALSAGERFTAILDTRTGLLVATDRGAVHLRDSNGWKTQRVSPALPKSASSSSRGTNKGSRPARAH